MYCDALFIHSTGSIMFETLCEKLRIKKRIKNSYSRNLTAWKYLLLPSSLPPPPPINRVNIYNGKNGPSMIEVSERGTAGC